MTRVANTIAVHGLKEAVTGLRKIDNNLPKQVRIAFNGAADLVIAKTRPLIPHKSGRAQASLKARSSQRQARIAIGGSKAPYYPWLDFGGHVGQHGDTARPFYKEGRYLYPTLKKYRPEIIALMQESVDQLIRDAGLDVD